MCSWRKRERKAELIEREDNFCEEEKREILNRLLELDGGRGRRRGVIERRGAEVRRCEDEKEGGFELRREEERSECRREVGEEERDEGEEMVESGRDIWDGRRRGRWRSGVEVLSSMAEEEKRICDREDL